MNSKPLTDKELQDLAENISDNEEMGSESENSDYEVSEPEDHMSEVSVEEDWEDTADDPENEIGSTNDCSSPHRTSRQVNEDSYSYVAKDGTEWSPNQFASTKSKRANIIKCQLHKVCLPPGKTIDDPVQAFYLYLDQEIVSEIVTCTNLEAARVLTDSNWKRCDAVELYAFFGLLLTAGHLGANYSDYNMLWNTFYGPPIFRATMGLNRFKFFLRFLRFDDKATRSERRKKDKFAPLRNLFEKVNDNFKKFYQPGAFLTVDEQLVPFRGRCPFKQYMPSKPDKYGMKIWWLCDAETYYPLKGIPYVGKEGNTVARNLAENVVESLCQPYYDTNRNVTMDNYFTTLELSQRLLRNGLTLLGTVRKNRRFIPREFLPDRKRAETSSIFGFRKNVSLVSYVTKKNKCVVLLSTMHHDSKIDEDNKQKPHIILDYNKTKGGVDQMDQMAHEYMCKRKTNRWPFAHFMNLLDLMGIAAYVIFDKLYPDWEKKRKDKRRRFLVSVCEDLVRPHIERRKATRLRKNLRESMDLVLQKTKPTLSSET